MQPTPEYAVSLVLRDGHYVPIIHLWERHSDTENAYRQGASGAKMIARVKALELANRLGVPFCESQADVSKALARYVVRSSGSNVAANNVKKDVLARHGAAAVAERYGLSDHTVRAIRDMLAGGSILVRS